MTAFSDLLGQGFAAMLEQAGATVTGPNDVARTGILSNLLRSKTLKDSGLLPECTGTLEITRDDAVSIAILDGEGSPVDRAKITVGTTQYLCMLIEDDPADPTIRLHLKRYRGA